MTAPCGTCIEPYAAQIIHRKASGFIFCLSELRCYQAPPPIRTDWRRLRRTLGAATQAYLGSMGSMPL